MLSSTVTTGFCQHNYHKLAIGLGIGPNQYYGDLRKNPVGSSTYAILELSLTPRVTAGIELQKGRLTGGDPYRDPSGRYFSNSYTTSLLNMKFFLWQRTSGKPNRPLNKLRHLYIGSGMGLINNKMIDIVRRQAKPGGYEYTFPGMDRSFGFLLGGSAGINFHFPNHRNITRFILNLHYEFNVATGDNVDGYKDPKLKFKNRAPDMYSVGGVGLKYAFGPEGVY